MNCIDSLKGQVWLMEAVSSVAGRGARVGMPPCILSQRGWASQRATVANSCNSELGPGATGRAGEERPPAKYGKDAKMWSVNSVGVLYIPEQVVSQFQLSVFIFYLVLWLQWSSIYQSVNWEMSIAIAKCCPGISLQQCKLTAETISH